MKNKPYGNMNYIILGLFFFTLGAFVTIFVKKTTSLTISNELYIPDLLMITITIGLTLYVGFVLERNNNKERIEKDIFINYINEYYIFLKERLLLIRENDYGQNKVASNFKIIRMRFYKLQNIAETNQLIDANNKLLNKIFKEVTKLWVIFTEGKDLRDINVEENIELILIKIEGLIFELTLEINNI